MRQPRGQAEAEVPRLVRRFGAVGRGLALVLISVFGVLAAPQHSLTLGWALLALAVVAGTADVWSGLSGKASGAVLMLSVVRAAAICWSVRWTDTEPGVVNQWAVNVLTITVITLQWEWPPRVTVPAVLVPIAALAAVFPLGAVAPVVLRVLGEGLISRLAFVVLVRSARELDEWRARRARAERDELLARERRRHEWEYLALLHDTAFATFLMVAMRGDSADPDEVAAHARRDLSVLTGSTDPHEGMVALEPALRSLVDETKLAVAVQSEAAPLVPAVVALALVRAVREALLNVERHAGVRDVVLAVGPQGKGVAVSVEDTGAGFDPAAVSPRRRGIRASLEMRMAAVGGAAVISSSPGEGTTVRLEWAGG